MGSGHFLVAAIDRIDKRFSTFLAENPIADVQNELARLRERASEILKEYGESLATDESDKLLRRQIARRCVYGVDLNPLAVELARLSIWVHTFVPGLPLSLLDYNLVPRQFAGRHRHHRRSHRDLRRRQPPLRLSRRNPCWATPENTCKSWANSRMPAAPRSRWRAS